MTADSRRDVSHGRLLGTRCPAIVTVFLIAVVASAERTTARSIPQLAYEAEFVMIGEFREAETFHVTEQLKGSDQDYAGRAINVVGTSRLSRRPFPGVGAKIKTRRALLFLEPDSRSGSWRLAEGSDDGIIWLSDPLCFVYRDLVGDGPVLSEWKRVRSGCNTSVSPAEAIRTVKDAIGHAKRWGTLLSDADAPRRADHLVRYLSGATSPVGRSDCFFAHAAHTELARLGPDAVAPLRMFLAQLPGSENARPALRALVACDRSGDHAVRAAMRLVESGPSHVALEALAVIGALNTRAATEALRTCLHHSKHSVRNAAALSLVHRRDSKGALAFGANLEQNPEEYEPCEAMGGLVALFEIDPVRTRTLARSLSEKPAYAPYAQLLESMGR